MQSGEELIHEQTKINHSREEIKGIQEKLRKLTNDEKPIVKEIVFYQQKLMQKKDQQKDLKINREKIQMHIEQLRMKNDKLDKQIQFNDQRMDRDSKGLHQYEQQINQSKKMIKDSNENYQQIDEYYHDLKDMTQHEEETTKRLKQKQTDLDHFIQILGQRQIQCEYQLKEFYQQIKRLHNEYLQHGKSSLVKF